MADGRLSDDGGPQPPVSRSRYRRAVAAREVAEALLEQRSRELWEANQQLKAQAATLE